LAKRLSEKEKKEIINRFSSGETIAELSEFFECTNSTITRNLKKAIGEIKYKELLIKRKSSDQFSKNFQTFPVSEKRKVKKDDYTDKKEGLNNNKIEEVFFETSPFMEITPLNYEIENLPQKDLSSIPITEVNLPKTVFMVVGKNIELEIKYLKDYPDWQFLSQEELNRKTIEIFNDLKVAKRFCNKEQKVIKVPNTNVFKIVAPILLSKGITRIVNSEKLIAI
tara:strand:- start:39 stop:710 length:672 start_codon:yes stop_codon:yes gene_type:complete